MISPTSTYRRAHRSRCTTPGTERAVQDLLRLDPERPRLERIVDAALGGKNNFTADRDRLIDLMDIAGVPALHALQAIPCYYQRVIAELSQLGIDQFVIIGTGVPTGLPPGQQLHDIARESAPSTRVVYIETDPLVLATARATVEPSTDLIRLLNGDARQPDLVLADPVLNTFIDWRQPVGLILGNLHELEDDEALHTLTRLRRLMCPGSYLTILQVTLDQLHPWGCATGHELIEVVAGIRSPRHCHELTPLLTGLDLLEPGIVPISHWRPTITPSVPWEPHIAGVYGAVARLPYRWASYTEDDSDRPAVTHHWQDPNQS
ncbi:MULTISPECIES: SAM-dependent methyltransferase [unclassified Nonomuraea]|uniref:SAM-dependent methyltransferase n=1 Tax=unclassified Nonomuraea TaxID=2593643 RepID=UPI00340B4E43